MRGGEVLAHAEPPSALPEDGHPVRVAPELGDLPLCPLHRGALILDPVVPVRPRRVVAHQFVDGEESEDVKAVVPSHDDDLGGC